MKRSFKLHFLLNLFFLPRLLCVSVPKFPVLSFFSLIFSVSLCSNFLFFPSFPFFPRILCGSVQILLIPRLFQDGADSSDAGGRALFLLDDEFTQDADMLDMGATADFLAEVAYCVDFYH